MAAVALGASFEEPSPQGFPPGAKVSGATRPLDRVFQCLLQNPQGREEVPRFLGPPPRIDERSGVPRPALIQAGAQTLFDMAEPSSAAVVPRAIEDLPSLPAIPAADEEIGDPKESAVVLRPAPRTVGVEEGPAEGAQCFFPLGL